MSAVNHADCHYDWVARVRLPWNCLINQCDQVCRGGDRIHGDVRTRTVTSATPYLDREILTKRRSEAGGDSCLSDRQIRVNVKRDDRIDAFQRSISHHFVRAAARFLRWLKDASPGHRKRPRTIKSERRPEQYRGMHIVTA